MTKTRKLSNEIKLGKHKSFPQPQPQSVSEGDNEARAIIIVNNYLCNKILVGTNPLPIEIARGIVWDLKPYLQSAKDSREEQKLVDVEDLLTTFCADVYGYAHKKKEVFGENREYFVTLEELDRVVTKFMENIKTQPTKDSRELQQ